MIFPMDKGTNCCPLVKNTGSTYGAAWVSARSNGAWDHLAIKIPSAKIVCPYSCAELVLRFKENRNLPCGGDCGLHFQKYFDDVELTLCVISRRNYEALELVLGYDVHVVECYVVVCGPGTIPVDFDSGLRLRSCCCNKSVLVRVSFVRCSDIDVNVLASNLSVPGGPDSERINSRSICTL